MPIKTERLVGCLLKKNVWLALYQVDDLVGCLLKQNVRYFINTEGFVGYLSTQKCWFDIYQHRSFGWMFIDTQSCILRVRTNIWYFIKAFR